MKQLLGISNIIRSAVLLCILSVFALSCVKDPTTSVSPQGDAVGLQLNILVPKDVATRSSTSVASDAELTILRGYIYVFNKDDTGTYVDHEEIVVKTNLVYLSGGKLNPTIYSDILTQDALITGKRVVLILNHQNISNLDFKSVTYSNLDTKFLLGGVGSSGKLKVGDGLPMYGEVESWSESALSNPITITRSVAKLLVQHRLGGVGGAYKDDFTPEAVTYGVFNHAISGHIKTPTTYLNASFANDYPFNGTLPDDYELGNPTNPETTVTATSTGVSYLYEYPYSTRLIGADAKTSTTVDNPATEAYSGRLAIILKVKGEITTRYYRLDLATQVMLGGPITYKDIKRNHQYRLVIREVNDAGYATADAAIKGAPSNVLFDLVDDTGSVTISNGRYAISVGEQPHGGKEVILNANNRTLEICNAVRYVLHPSLSSLPSDVINSITCSGDPLPDGDQITISPTSLSADTKKLKLTIPFGYKGKINYVIRLGDLIYNSAEHGAHIEGVQSVDLGITVADWIDKEVDGDIDGHVTLTLNKRDNVDGNTHVTEFDAVGSHAIYIQKTDETYVTGTVNFKTAEGYDPPPSWLKEAKWTLDQFATVKKNIGVFHFEMDPNPLITETATDYVIMLKCFTMVYRLTAVKTGYDAVECTLEIWDEEDVDSDIDGGKTDLRFPNLDVLPPSHEIYDNGALALDYQSNKAIEVYYPTDANFTAWDKGAPNILPTYLPAWLNKIVWNKTDDNSNTTYPHNGDLSFTFEKTNMTAPLEYKLKIKSGKLRRIIKIVYNYGGIGTTITDWKDDGNIDGNIDDSGDTQLRCPNFSPTYAAITSNNIMTSPYKSNKVVTVYYPTNTAYTTWERATVGASYTSNLPDWLSSVSWTKDSDMEGDFNFTFNTENLNNSLPRPNYRIRLKSGAITKIMTITPQQEP